MNTNKNSDTYSNKKSKYSMTSCSKTGIKIKHSNNEHKYDPFADVDPFKNHQKESDKIYNETPQNHMFETIDLNIENYSREELYKLFGFKTSIILTEDYLKEAKNIVLKVHPDKSHLESKYFIFFKKAYEKLKHIYDFQNKSSKKNVNAEDYDSDKNVLLEQIFETNKELKEPKQFNKWFNEQFDKHKIEDSTEHGYGDWLKSDEGIVFTPQNINKDTMGREMDKRKKQIQSLTTYNGFNDHFSSSTAGGSSLMEYNNNFSSSGMNHNEMGYTDLRQAYVESVIPVTDDDYHKIPKFQSIDQYKRHRDTTNITPMSKEESLRNLYYQEKDKNEESAALAYYYAQQSEKVKQNSEHFWSGLKQLTR